MSGNASAVFDTVFATAASGRPASFTLHHPNGGSHHFDPAAWFRDHLPGDHPLLDRCTGPTLDVGCGPGRLTGALARAGRPALGIDISATAVRHARRRGAIALQRDVFDPLPGTGRWHHLLLADGNIGIGGDPHRLLDRCRQLLAPNGQIHAELAAPGTLSWAGTVALRDEAGSGDVSLRWAVVPLDELAALAAATALRILDTRTENGRWFATLTPRGASPAG
jgi:SAM-dependent methyltransferase